VRFHSIDGSALAGVLTLPDGLEGPAPAVLLCQGLSGVKHLVLPQVAAALADDFGLASLRFDYRGCGESRGTPGWVDPRARADDALYALAWLASEDGVDDQRVGVYGHSYGGPIAIVTAARDQRVRALVSVSGPGDGESMLRAIRTSWEWTAFGRRRLEERVALARTGTAAEVSVDQLFPFSPAFEASYAAITATAGGTSAMAHHSGGGLPRYFFASADAMADFHPADYARRLHDRALLVVHGTEDDTAPLEDALELFDAAPGEKRLLRFAGLAHNDLDEGVGLQRAVAAAGTWLAEHLT
jgi:uncharacterized protein